MQQEMYLLRRYCGVGLAEGETMPVWYRDILLAGIEAEAAEAE